MTDIEKIQLTHPYLRALKLLLLILAVLLFIADIWIYYQTDFLAKTYTDQQNQATWFLFHLTKEFSELVAHSAHMQSGLNGLGDVWLKYELTWSRFDLMINNREADSFMQLVHAQQFFLQLFSEFQKLETLLEMADSGDAEAIKQFHSQSETLYLSMIDYINQNFRVASPLYEEQRAQAKALATADFYLVIGLMVCICLLVFVFYKELEFNKRLALTDPLTGLLNRLALFNLIEGYSKRGEPFSLFLLDLNDFKKVNDNYGHHAGDAVLMEVSYRLKQLAENQCVAFRIGGDEFALVLKSGSQFENSQTEFCTHVTSQFLRPFESATLGFSFNFSTSIGGASYPDEAVDIDKLVMIADSRMYRMKNQSKVRQRQGFW